MPRVELIKIRLRIRSLTDHSHSGGFCSTKASCQIVGRIFNAVDLAKSVGLPKGESAPDVLSAAFQVDGLDAIKELNGEFALLILCPNSRELIVASDCFGSVPLYWHYDGSTFACANRITDLIQLLDQRVDIDSDVVASFLRQPRLLGSYTMFRDIRLLGPGELLRVSHTGVRAHKWWSPNRTEDVRFGSKLDYTAALSDVVTNCIQDRLNESQVPAGHISGGLDSTLTSLFAQEELLNQSRRSLRTYSWSPLVSHIYPMMQDDERERIATLDSEFGLSTQLTGRDDCLITNFLQRHFELEGPCNLFEELEVIAAAREEQVDVILSGWGGDECLSAQAPGVPAMLMRNGNFRASLACLRKVRRANKNRTSFGSWPTLIRGNLLLPLLPSAIQDVFPYFSKQGSNKYISESLRSHGVGTESRPTYKISAKPKSDLIRLLTLGHLSERMTTWWEWGFQNQIRYSYPLLDRRLVEFVLGCPAEIYWGDSQPRYLIRSLLGHRMKGFFDKRDNANERKKLSSYRHTWVNLSNQAKQGRFDRECFWLNKKSLKADLISGPSGDALKDILAFQHIMVAVRVWFMAERRGYLG